ncbi:DEAD/DEAH box helicase [Soonwooa sp.]|uniref:DEAD/DEAH box helicase n=1 Tax=Soonwooa sp. TaxID=1938592 RepID=UPI00261748EC|nr:DEAD/DEAH box helicase [Soonwooa sp.]
MTTYEMLSEPIRRYIRDKRWDSFRPIQETAIQRITSTDNNYVLISRTASGKTEAAFLPILSKVNFKEPGVKVLYISPLIALINDQFLRVEQLCNYLDVSVTKWHGEANKSGKDRLLKDPNGIVLITPESIEAMFCNKPYNVVQLFSSLEYVVIDEIHNFLGSDRGLQLQSLIHRLQQKSSKKVSVVGLSATVSDVNQYEELKTFFGDPINTKIIRDITPKPINADFRYFDSQSTELPLDLLKDLYKETRDCKALVFPNARGRVEEVAVKLKKISEKIGGHQNYFSHHSAVDKETREYVEFFAKNTNQQNFTISCTSTLELGIDIGNVDKVVQIDATHSIASLIQRIGRSGRREGKSSNLVLYSTDSWSFLQSLASWLLYQEHFIEPVFITEKPYDVLLHQILSIVKSSSGIEIEKIYLQISNNPAFLKISKDEILSLISHLIGLNFLEKIGNEIILGIDAEPLVNSKDFYSLFKTDTFLKVVNSGNKIGELPLSSQLIVNENVFLSARIWKIIDIDFKSKKIEVIPANDGKKPLFFGSSADVAAKIREKMFVVLLSKDGYDFLDEKSQFALSELRKEFSFFKIENIKQQRPVLVKDKSQIFYTFSSTKVNSTISFLLSMKNIDNHIEDNSSAIIVNNIELSMEEFSRILANIDMLEIDRRLQMLLAFDEGLDMLEFSKWAAYLPLEMQIDLIKTKYFDFDSVKVFGEEIDFVV